MSMHPSDDRRSVASGRINAGLQWLRARMPSTGVCVLMGALLTAAIAAACANVTAPEGGPEDQDAPLVLKSTPLNGATDVKPKEVVIQFNEVISETPRGAPDLASLVFISPKSGKPSVDWQRSRIVIKPKKGFKANTVYSITVSPGILDLRNNQVDSTIRLVFSTGGPIPNTHITGVVFDWVLGKVAPKALVEAIARDSTTYQVLADSIGRYDLGFVPPGNYKVRAYTDRNSNRELDPLEAWDTTSVQLTTTMNAELYTFTHDTVGLRINEMTVIDSGRVLKIAFDKPYAADQQFNQQSFTIKRSDSTQVQITLIQSAPLRAMRDSLLAKAKVDSAARANQKVDSTPAMRAAADSAARKRRTDSLVALDRADREARRLAALRGGRIPPPRDTTPPPKMKRPLVYNEVYLTLALPLDAAKQFRVQANAIKSLSGTVRSPSRTLTTPKPEKIDSTLIKRIEAAKKDSLAKKDSVTKKDTTAVPKKSP